MFLKGLVSTGEIQPYEMIERGDHEYEEVSKFQQPSGGEYEILPPPPPRPQRTVDAGDDFEVTECIAYNTTTHGPPPPNTTSGDPLYDN